MEITKTFKFEGSHVVRNCTSKRCSHSVHGHSYTVEITFEASKLDNGQMVMDFGLMKDSIKSFIDTMDHCHMICTRDSQEYQEFFKKHNARWIMVPFNPSAEMISLFVMSYVQKILDCTEFNNGESKDLVVKNVTVWETATGRAKCSQEDHKNIWKIEYENEIIFSPEILDELSDELVTILECHGYIDKIIKNPKIKQQIPLKKENFSENPQNPL